MLLFVRGTDGGDTILDGCSMVSGHAMVEWSWRILMSSWATLPMRDIKPSATTVPTRALHFWSAEECDEPVTCLSPYFAVIVSAVTYLL